jgi:hypothetical protein
MSMMGLAAKPGTDVDPTCSTLMIRPPRTSLSNDLAAANRSTQAGS